MNGAMRVPGEANGQALGVMAEALNLHRSTARVVDARSMSIFLPATTIVLRHANGATLMCRTMPATAMEPDKASYQEDGFDAAKC